MRTNHLGLPSSGLQSKVIFTAPTRPLVRQQFQAICETVAFPKVLASPLQSSAQHSTAFTQQQGTHHCCRTTESHSHWHTSLCSIRSEALRQATMDRLQGVASGDYAPHVVYIVWCLQGAVVQLKASNSEKRHAEWESKRVFFCTPQVSFRWCVVDLWSKLIDVCAFDAAAAAVQDAANTDLPCAEDCKRGIPAQLILHCCVSA